MQKGLLDKIWFLNLLPPHIKTIVDFGCADGSLIKFIETLFPNRFHFIGIDNDEEMRKRAKKNLANLNERFEILPSITKMSLEKSLNSVLVLNSIIHEIMTYCSYQEQMEIYRAINFLRFDYIAIRDMHYQTDIIGAEKTSIMLNAFSSKNYTKFEKWEKQKYYMKESIQDLC